MKTARARSRITHHHAQATHQCPMHSLAASPYRAPPRTPVPPTRTPYLPPNGRNTGTKDIQRPPHQPTQGVHPSRSPPSNRGVSPLGAHPTPQQQFAPIPLLTESPVLSHHEGPATLSAPRPEPVCFFIRAASTPHYPQPQERRTDTPRETYKPPMTPPRSRERLLEAYAPRALHNRPGAGIYRPSLLNNPSPRSTYTYNPTAPAP